MHYSFQYRGFVLNTKKRNLEMMHAHAGVGFLGRFKNGQVDGHFWAGMINGGYLHGKVDKNGLITGDKIAYIYPDGETAYFGHFENKVIHNGLAIVFVHS